MSAADPIPGLPPCTACGHPIRDGEDYTRDGSAWASHYGRCPTDPQRLTIRQQLDLMEK